MPQTILITIQATVPDDKADLAHEAIVNTKEAVNNIVEDLGNLGLTVTIADRRLVRLKKPNNTAKLVQDPKPAV